MKRLVLAAALAAGAVGCSPDIAQNEAVEPSSTQPRFDLTATPPVVPSPNDLARNPATGKLAVPLPPNASDAEKELNAFLNNLDGFPTSTTVSTTFTAALDPASVNADTVKIVDVTDQKVVTGTVSYVPAAQDGFGLDRIVVLGPNGGRWLTGHQYGVAVTDGVKGTDGKPVLGTSTWTFISSAQPLATCLDQPYPACQTTTELLPATSTDPSTRLAEQTAAAQKLEPIRLLHKPALDVLDANGVKRENVSLAWVFTTVGQPTLVFEPGRSIIPFPSALVTAPSTTTPTGFKVNLPIPAGASATQQALYGGLNTLDGLSLTAPIASENSDALGALDVGKIDQTLLSGAAAAQVAGFVKLSTKLTANTTNPVVKVCVDCSVSPQPSTGPKPETLQFVPQVPLDEQTVYGAYVTAALKATDGKPVLPDPSWVLMRSKNSLVTAQGKSAVSSLSDVQAQTLEGARRAFAPMLDGLAASGLTREKLLLAFPYPTQSTVSVGKQLYGGVKATPTAALPDVPLYVQDVTATVKGQMAAGGIPSASIAKVFTGEIVIPFALTGASGTLNPDNTKWRAEFVPFTLTVPAAAGNLPVTFFGHGLQGNRNQALAIANSLAQGGQAMLAIDTVFHGDRSVCVGSASVLGTGATDDAACADPTKQKCETTATSPSFGRCVAKAAADRAACNPAPGAGGDFTCRAQNQGLCLADSKCEGGDFKRDASGAPVISGWNILNTSNLFATRDNFRQRIIDMAQVERVLSSAAATGIDAQLSLANGAPLALDETHLNYAGQSLGGILGTLYTGVSTQVQRSVLNVPGGDPAAILLTAPAFAAQKTAFIGSLASAGIAENSPAFDQFTSIARWILDPADPRTFAYALRNTSGTSREVLIQYITGDQVVPNPTTQALIDAANRTGAANTTPVTKFDPATGTDAQNRARHGFLLSPTASAAATVQAQTDVVNFVAAGVVPPATR
jgi:dienelactone hydrolase